MAICFLLILKVAPFPRALQVEDLLLWRDPLWSGGTLLLSTVLYGKVGRESSTWSHLPHPSRSCTARMRLFIASTPHVLSVAFAVALYLLRVRGHPHICMHMDTC